MWVLYVYVVPRNFILLHSNNEGSNQLAHPSSLIRALGFCYLGCKRVSCCIQTDTSEQIAATIVDAKHIQLFTGQVLPYIWLLLYHTSGYCFTIHLANVYHTSGYCLPYIWLSLYRTSGYCFTNHTSGYCLNTYENKCSSFFVRF